MRCLVTGGSGFLGQHLVNRLTQEPEVERIYSASRSYLLGKPHSHPKVRNLYLDCESDNQVSRFFDEAEVDVVFHLAANPLVKQDPYASPTAITQSNVLATHNLLAYCTPDCRFIFASSATVYGDAHIPKEDHICVPTSYYAATKVASEALVCAATKLGKVKGTSLRLVANVGPGATHGVVYDLVRKAISDERHLTVLGEDPGSWKVYCHVTDTATAFVKAWKNKRWWAHNAINIGPRDDTDVISSRMIAHTVLSKLGSQGVKKPISFLGKASNWVGDNNIVAVNGDLARSLGWEATRTSLEAVGDAVLEVKGSMYGY